MDEYDHIFDPNIKGYNGAEGPFEARVNMGPVEPPQRNGRLPQYARHQLLELQQKFDKLETLGVFKRPEDINIPVECLNPSFLIKKPSGGYHLLTAFADVGRYSKPQPSPMPDIDSTLRLIAQWKHIIATDLTSAFYQIPLSRDSVKYCGVATPFRGERVYARFAMGMPGSETALEELMSRALGDLLKDGIVTKIADDLLPCEVEALAIAVATKHLYLIQSHHKVCILTDSKPCVQAYEKLCRGEFSARPRVSTFLSTVSRYQASVRHVSGSAILPADFACRNAAPCEDEACQVCTFTRLTQDSVIRRTSIQDILSGNGHLPFTSRTAWLATQSECPDLRRTHAHLQQGTRPSKKLTNMKDVKRYLNVTTIAKDGLLVDEPLAPTRECIVVPRQVLERLRVTHSAQSSVQ